MPCRGESPQIRTFWNGEMWRIRIDCWLMDRIGIRPNATVGKMKNFVVNLDRQPEKYERFLTRNEGCGIAFERFPAVDGSKLTNEEVMAMGIVAPGSRFAPGTVGGTASMSQIWKQVAEQDEPALVFEDDCTIRHDILPRLATLLPSLGDDWDMLVLGYNTDSI